MNSKYIFWIILGFAVGLIAVMALNSCETEDTVALPTLTTLPISEITANSAKSGGNITDNGGGEITSRGVVWETEANPTLENHSGVTVNGNGPGVFQSNLANLSASTIYFVRAYATNSAGTAYGGQVEFTTKDWLRDNQTQVVEVTNPATGKTWMDRNLGASRAANTSTDEEAYGDLYQWGRAADGHQKRHSGTNSTLSSTNTPGHGNFILAPDSPYDWRNPQNDELWQGVNGVNNPCPNGYRLPTEAEWEAERQSWSTSNSAGAFASPLKLPVAGGRSRSAGALSRVDTRGYYWSSSLDSSLSQLLLFTDSDASMSNTYRAIGGSVRCIKD